MLLLDESVQEKLDKCGNNCVLLLDESVQEKLDKCGNNCVLLDCLGGTSKKINVIVTLTLDLPPLLASCITDRLQADTQTLLLFYICPCTHIHISLHNF